MRLASRSSPKVDSVFNFGQRPETGRGTRTLRFGEGDEPLELAASDNELAAHSSASRPHLNPRAAVLDLLPSGHVFDGELIVLDDAGRPLFNELLCGRGRTTYVAFDLLMANGVDLWPGRSKSVKAAGEVVVLSRRRSELRQIGRTGDCSW